MPRQLQRLFINFEGKICSTARKKVIPAFPHGEPMLVEVDMREIVTDSTNREETYVGRLERALFLQDRGRSELTVGYVAGEHRPSYAQGYVYVPVQFYRKR